MDRPAERGFPRVADLALLSDRNGAAMVARDGEVVWWCAPRFDSRSVFASLLDADAGRFLITPDGPWTCGRRYLPGTLVLETTFRTGGGAVRLTDALALDPVDDAEALGRTVPHALIRTVEGLEGEVDLRVEFAPRLEYGRVTPPLAADGDEIWTTVGPDALLLRTDLPLQVTRATARGAVRVRAGERRSAVVHHRQGFSCRHVPRLAADEALRDTRRAWERWSDTHLTYEGPYRDAVHASMLLMHALTHAPTGALVAAATTSLPEVPHGGATWDYRYGWLRDASFTARALAVTGCPHEVRDYVEWMSRVAGDVPFRDRLQIVFGVGGERDLSERILDHLGGHRDDGPVRVGNAAWRQRQVDVPGEVLDAAAHLGPPEGGFASHLREFLLALAERAAREHRSPDSGIWEGREGERHYTVSKVMSWVALNRAVALAPHLGDGADPARWARLRDHVRSTILREGWHDGVGAFTGAFGSHHLDAGVLMMPLVGFLPMDDARMRRTVEVVRRDLGAGGLVRRWTGAHEDAGFLPATFWLADCLARDGDLDGAHAVMERGLACANDLGMLPEAASPSGGEPAGNTPLVISHVGLVNAAVTLARADARVPAEPRG